MIGNAAMLSLVNANQEYMLQTIPHFKYHPRRISSKNLWCIEANGQVMHEISDTAELDNFYKVFGYSKEMALAGILPDEFIWAEYVKGTAAKYSDCYRMHIIEYLSKHSDKFRNTYGDECAKWMAAHADTKAAGDELCVACRMKLFCSKRFALENCEMAMFTDAQRKIVEGVLEKKRLNPLYKPTHEENAIIDAVLQATREA